MRSAILAVLLCAACSRTAPTETAKLTKLKTRELTFQADGLKLVGTLELPTTGSGPYPALLLLPGSGPTDRDGNSGLGITTDLLKDIALELAKHGIASYRFDKRAIRHYAADWPKTPEAQNKFFSFDHFVDDATRAFDLLREQPEINPARVGVLGHSEGALLSLELAASRSGKPTAPETVILLGSTGRPMGPILHEQINRQLQKSGLPAAEQKRYLDYVDASCAALAERKPLTAKAPQGLESLFNPTTANIVGAYCRIDPASLAPKVNGAVLVINGEKDTQVSAVRDTPKIIAALKLRTIGSVDSLIVPNASHNLKDTVAGGDDAFGGPVVPAGMTKILEFAKKNLQN